MQGSAGAPRRGEPPIGTISDVNSFRMPNRGAKIGDRPKEEGLRPHVTSFSEGLKANQLHLPAINSLDNAVTSFFLLLVVAHTLC